MLNSSNSRQHNFNLKPQNVSQELPKINVSITIEARSLEICNSAIKTEITALLTASVRAPQVDKLDI